MQQILTSIAVIVIGVLLLVFAAWLFFGLLVVFVIGYGLYIGRDFLTKKGILNPRPGVPIDEQQENVTIIEGDFERIEGSEKKD